MATPTTDPSVSPVERADRIVVLPDSALIRPVPPTVPAPTPTSRWIWVVIAVLGAAALIALIAAAWAANRVDDTSSDLTATETELAVAVDEAARLEAQVAMLESQAVRTQTEVEGLEREVELLQARLADARSATEQAQTSLSQTEAELSQAQVSLAQTQTELARTQAALTDARGDLRAITGSPLSTGSHAGRLFMVGGTQVPPMLAFDEMRLFRGQDAIDAMIADGVPPTEARRCGPDCVYWRNPSPRWRVLTIAPDATVRLRTYPTPGAGPVTVSLSRFTAIFNGGDPGSARIANRPYRLTIAGGEVTAIEEKNLTW